ncbi:MAG: cobalamin biosynthesis protein CobD [Alphaproteobacteria bacterium]|nr:cobalamin biosynthesis protein CobD [Alphaproteobacteria bacterium]
MLGSTLSVAGVALPLVLLGALALDALVGDPPWLWRAIPHPVALTGNLTFWLDRRLNRPQRGARTRFVLGLVVALAVTALAWGAGLAIVAAARLVTWGWAAELLLVAILVAQRSLFDHVAAVARALRRDGLSAARAAVGRIVGRDPDRLDSHAVARAAIESTAENFADGVVGPVLWYLVLGLPGLFVLKAINTMDSMVGHRTARHAAFGAVAARLDDAAMFVPARMAAALIVLAAIFVPGGRPWAALRTWWWDGHRHRSPNAGRPEAAMAGAIGVALSGPRSYHGAASAEPWLGGEFSARAEAGDIRRALFVLVVACLLQAAAVGALAALSYAPV